MATKKTVKKDVTSPSDEYIEFKLPHTSQTTRLLLVLIILIGFVFFAGYQTAKVTYWEQKEKSLNTALAGATQGQAAQPTPTPAFYSVGTGHLPILGKANAKVTIVEFSDLQCLYCRGFWKDTLPQLTKDYIDKGLVKLAYRQFPLPATLHPAARDLAEAAECANDQNKFWDFEDEAFKEQAAQGDGTISVSADDITNYAQTIGLDMTQFSDCFSTKKDASKIDTDMADGQKVNVSSTPTFYINGQIVVGALPYDSFKTIIDQALKK